MNLSASHYNKDLSIYLSIYGMFREGAFLPATSVPSCRQDIKTWETDLICTDIRCSVCHGLNNSCRVTHICVGKLAIIGSDNGVSPRRRQAIIWISSGILLNEPLGANFNDILIKIETFLLMKIRLKMSSAKCCPFHLRPQCVDILHLIWDKNFLKDLLSA